MSQIEVFLIEVDGTLSLRTASEQEFKSYLSGLLLGANFGQENTEILFGDLHRIGYHGWSAFNLPDRREVRMKKGLA